MLTETSSIPSQQIRGDEALRLAAASCVFMSDVTS